MTKEVKIFKGPDGEQVTCGDKYTNLKPEIRSFSIEQLNWKARLTLRLIERWGLITGVEGGEDSQGRAKMKVETPEGIVERAIEIADRTVSRLRELGWVERGPSYEDVYGIDDEEERQ